MEQYISHNNLQIAKPLYSFLMNEVFPDSGVKPNNFWLGLESLLHDLMPVNKALLAKRDELQTKIDRYCLQHKQITFSHYQTFLTEIGYLEKEPEHFVIDTQNVDPEISTMAGPQLVVPINNARFALNAANARWGSLYDAVYGSNIINLHGETAKGKGYNLLRGKAVVNYARKWLDIIIPLASGSHLESTHYQIINGELVVSLGEENTSSHLKNPEQLKGYTGDITQPESILFINNHLHIDIQFDGQSPNASGDAAKIKDIIVESALTTIMDCEDSVAAVDAQDKTLVYKNWLGLIKGDLSAELTVSKQVTMRHLNADRHYTSTSGQRFSLNGRSLMFIRNVGHLMDTDAIKYHDQMIPEGIMDAVITSLIAKHDLINNGKFKNSASGSVYIVKPKMHGSQEVAFTDTLFARVEQLLGLPLNTLKMGIMDEERRTSINLKACIHAAKSRVVFINTGFLDRTGDEIHTSMLLGPFACKAELKKKPWLNAYEENNVHVGLLAGMSGKAQIGKGMWPVPDQLNEMMDAKINHVQSGANTAWVPSPTAATLHALHYHQTNVFSLREKLQNLHTNNLEKILSVPLLDKIAHAQLDDATIQNELDNNVQGIIGYVVRWINQGIGCSKVPDINGIGLMEDRATLRISSQHIANWLEHGIVNEKDVMGSMLKMAALVDQQNADDREYTAITTDIEHSVAFEAAKELIFNGKNQPNGYTEPLLHIRRRQFKNALKVKK